MRAGSTERLPRLLSLVPYLLARPGIRVAEAAADFGITERQLRRDLELLWMCGLPGYGPGDLVDLSFAGDTVTVTEDAGMRRPLRLTTAEATALLVALRTLGDVPGVVDTAAVRRATAKIEHAVGDARARPGWPSTSTREEEAATAAVRAALSGRPGAADPLLHRRPRRGLAAHRRPDAAADRRRPRLPGGLVPPGRGRCGCSGSTGSTTSCCSTSRPRRPPDAEPTDVSDGLFRPRADHRSAVLLLAPGGALGGRVLPGGRGRRELDGGGARVLLRYADPAWLVRLVLGLGGGARLLEPAELAEAVAAGPGRRWPRAAAREGGPGG